MPRKLFSILGLALILSGCAIVVPTGETTQSTQVISLAVDCKNPPGQEYICYNEENCDDYFRGYGAVIVERIFMQRYHGWYPGIKTHVIPINVFADHSNTYYLGKFEVTQAGENKIHMKMWLNIYDMDCSLLHEGFREGQLTQKKPVKEKKSYEQNSYELKAIRR